jgi:diacylglycerol kinase (ATP)
LELHAVQVTLIHNPGAGSEDASAERLIELLRASGHEVRYQSAKDDSWAEALDEPAGLVVVAGGDGTVSRVAKRMVKRGMPLAVLPCGTANNIARTLGLAGVPLEDLVESWRAPRRVKLDIGVARGPWGTRYFAEGLGVGLFAWTIPDADSSKTLASLERNDAKIAYALQMLKDRLDQCEAVAGRFVLFEAMIIPFVGPNLFLAPESKPGDGRFDVVLVTESECDRVRQYLSSWQEEKPRLPVLPSYRGSSLSLRWSGFELHIDDQLWPPRGETPPEAPAMIELSLESEGVEVLVPPELTGE